LTLVELQKHDAAGRSPAQNALFAGHELGAGNWVAIASLVETCKLNAINPNAYLADVLARVVVRPDGDPLDDLLPGNWVDTRAAETTFETSDICDIAKAVSANDVLNKFQRKLMPA